MATPPIIDLRSDTVSLPSDEMIEAITQAHLQGRLGDDVYGEKQMLRFQDAMKYSFDSLCPAISRIIKTYKLNNKHVSKQIILVSDPQGQTGSGRQPADSGYTQINNLR